MTPAKARRLFKGGASARGVVRDAGIRQASLAEATGLPQSRISDVLAGRRVGGPRGREMAQAIYQAIAIHLEIDASDIPEAQPYLTHEVER